jgi:hypothetical protein
MTKVQLNPHERLGKPLCAKAVSCSIRGHFARLLFSLVQNVKRDMTGLGILSSALLAQTLL